ncbi:MAG: sigma factor-like helix-turn-helix DNA-binding protein, partial [Ignavibacteriota bacterium]
VALEKFERMKSHEHFAGFLFLIASRLHKRRRYRERFRMNYNRVAAEAREDPAQHPDKAAEISILMDALQKLPKKMKETIMLADIADLSLEEILAIQRGTLSGVKSRLKRGREMLQKHLGIRKDFTMAHAGKPALKKGEYYAL